MGIRVKSDSQRWRNGEIPFEIDEAAFTTGQLNDVRSAIDKWNADSPFVRLITHNGELNFAEFTGASERCHSDIGMKGGRQRIRCDLTEFREDSILHEIGHAAGLFHEICRSDRDEFVTIIEPNIKPDALFNFKKHVSDGQDLGAYDYDSLMHYPPDAFQKAAGLTTIALPDGVTTGDAIELSPGDRDALRLTYEGIDGWVRMAGALTYVSTGSQNVQWGVNADHEIFQRTGNSWNKIKGKLKQLSVASDGTLWGVNSNNEIFRRDDNDWVKISGKLTHVAVGSSDIVWGVNADGDIFQRDGNEWKKIAGELKQISVAADGTIWGVNAGNEIFRRDGSKWTKIPGKLKHVAVGSSSMIWGVNQGNEIFVRRGDAWDKISGKLKQISVASDGSVWGVNADNEIFRD